MCTNTAKSFCGLVHMLFGLPEVKGHKLAFLSRNINQDPIENFFGYQRQRGATNENPSVMDFYHNTQALRVVNGMCRGPVRGNCRGARTEEKLDDSACIPLAKRKRK